MALCGTMVGVRSECGEDAMFLDRRERTVTHHQPNCHVSRQATARNTFNECEIPAGCADRDAA